MRQHEWKKRQAPAQDEPALVALEAVSPGPAQWLAGPGAWAAAAPLLQALPQPVGLAGEAGLLKRFRKPLTEAWLEAGVDLVLLALPDGVECCEAQAQSLAAAAQAKGCGTLIGFGGGKALDLAKWASQLRPMALVTAPSSAATCASASAVVVVNRDDGSFERVLDMPRPAQLCIVDYEALLDAPPRLLAAGLADSLAKWLEWRALEGAPAGFGGAAAWALAERGAQVCVSLGAEALQEPGSAAWVACVEACLLGSAAASCLGHAPAAAAHSLANALTAQPSGRTLIHGEQVGLGLLWQEALLGEASTVGAILRSWGMPLQLPEGLDLEALVEAAILPGETVHAMDREVSYARASDALKALMP